MTTSTLDYGSRVKRLDNAKDHGPHRSGAPELIVWHCTAGDRADAAMEWMNSDKATASYHYIVDKDGTIYRFLAPEFIAYHAGESAWPVPAGGVPEGASINRRSLGISFANDNGSDANELDDQLTPEQVQSALWLALTLMKRYGIPAENNIGHRECAPTRKTDPLPEIMKMPEWRESLASLSAARDAGTLVVV